MNAVARATLGALLLSTPAIAHSQGGASTAAPKTLVVVLAQLPVEAIRAMNPQRGEPPMLIPQAKYFTVRVPFSSEDLQAAERSMLCHKTQVTPETAQRVLPATAHAWNGAISLIPAFTTAPGTELFR